MIWLFLFVFTFVICIRVLLDRDKYYKETWALKHELDAEWKRYDSLYFKYDLLERKLEIATNTLHDIYSQNDFDPQFKVWAKKRAFDTLNILGEGMNPKMTTFF